jgi:hypothetical protein
MDQVSINYTNIFHCKTFQNLPKFGFLVWKQTIWQPSVCLPDRFSRRWENTRTASRCYLTYEQRCQMVYHLRTKYLNLHFLGFWKYNFAIFMAI